MDRGLHSGMSTDADMGVSGGGRLCLADSTLARCLFWICFYSRCGFATVDVDAVCVARRAVMCEAVKAFNGSVPVYHHDICNGVFTATVFVLFPLSGGADTISMMDARGGGRRTKDEAEESAADALLSVLEENLKAEADDITEQLAKLSM